VLEPAPRVGDYASRGQVVKGVCRANGCFRRVELEPKALSAQGLAAITMEQVKRLYRCARLDRAPSTSTTSPERPGCGWSSSSACPTCVSASAAVGTAASSFGCGGLRK
jgi:hypothetical protein